MLEEPIGGKMTEECKSKKTINGEQWCFLRPILGMPLLKYILNIDFKCSYSTNFKDIENNLTSEQLEAGAKLHESIKNLFVKAMESSQMFEFCRIQAEKYFPKFKALSSKGEVIPTLKKSDLLLYHLQETAISQ